jgi:hypothetical protein
VHLDNKVIAKLLVHIANSYITNINDPKKSLKGSILRKNQIGKDTIIIFV